MLAPQSPLRALVQRHVSPGLWQLRAWAGVLVVCVSLHASQAEAFCRETTQTPSVGPCVEPAGAPRLHWTRPCTSYVFNDQLFAQLSLLTEREIRDAFQASYDAWAEIDCNDDREPFLVTQAAGVTTTRTAEFVFDAPNESIVVARTRAEWIELEHAAAALALTLLWHDTDSGEILDVDMELNTGAGRYADCARIACGRDMMDLQNTITHEAGHVLGLGHTPIDGATMEEAALDGEVAKRSLASDDIAGYCSLDLPAPDCDAGRCVCEPPSIFPSTRTVTTCGCRSVGAQPDLSAFSLVFGAGLLLALRRRRSAIRARRACSPQR